MPTGKIPSIVASAGPTKAELLESAEVLFTSAQSVIESGGRDEDILHTLWAKSSGNLPLNTPDGQLNALTLTRWAENGYPQVTMGHKFAAALLVTNVEGAVLDEVRPPWNGFLIEVPSGLLEIYNNALDEYRPIVRILVARHSSSRVSAGSMAWMYIAFTDSSITIWRFGVSTRELLPERMGTFSPDRDPTLVELTDQDERVTSLIGRLIINVCLTMNDPSMVKEIGKSSKKSTPPRRRPGELPAVRTFQIGKPITMDFRNEVQTYVRYGTAARRQINIQVLVAGHFKHVVHGKGRQLRRWQWIEPYWKGDVEAPILIRPHKIDEDS